MWARLVIWMKTQAFIKASKAIAGLRREGTKCQGDSWKKVAVSKGSAVRSGWGWGGEMPGKFARQVSQQRQEKLPCFGFQPFSCLWTM